MVGKTEWMRVRMRMRMRMSEDYVWACGSEKVGATKRGRGGEENRGFSSSGVSISAVYALILELDGH